MGGVLLEGGTAGGGKVGFRKFCPEPSSPEPDVDGPSPVDAGGCAAGEAVDDEASGAVQAGQSEQNAP